MIKVLAVDPTLDPNLLIPCTKPQDASKHNEAIFAPAQLAAIHTLLNVSIIKYLAKFYRRNERQPALCLTAGNPKISIFNLEKENPDALCGGAES